jgi:predicted nucleotidyltransferase
MVDYVSKNSIYVRSLRNFSHRLAKKYRLKKVYLFGSLADGLFFKGSDIDLAIEGMDFEDYLKILAEEREIKGVHLDILHMDFCRPELKKNILKNGKLLYEKKQ